MSQLAKRARHPSQLLELPVTKTPLLNTPFQLTMPIDTRHGIPQADAVANSDVVEEKLIGGFLARTSHVFRARTSSTAPKVKALATPRCSDSKTGSILDPTGGDGAYLRGFRRRTCTRRAKWAILIVPRHARRRRESKVGRFMPATLAVWFGEPK